MPPPNLFGGGYTGFTLVVASRPVPSPLNIAYNVGYLWWIALQFGTHTHCSKTRGDNLDNSCRHFAWIIAPF